MVDWVSSLGGVEQWMFSINQRAVQTVGEGVLAERAIDGDIEFITRTKQRFPGAKYQRITMVAEHLTIDQLGALAEIKDTNSLRVYLNRDGSKFIDAVTVEDFTVPFYTKDLLHTFSLTIEFPDSFNFFAAKEY